MGILHKGRCVYRLYAFQTRLRKALAMEGSAELVSPASCEGAEGVRGSEAHVALLESRLEEHQMRNENLEERLSQANERLDKEVQKRQIMELDRQILIDTLMERAEELRERETTIDTQNCLLGLAWTDAQELRACHQETARAIELLRDYFEVVLAGNATHGAGSQKKRKMSP